MYNVSFLFCVLSHTINYYYLNTKFQYQCSVLSNRIEFERKWLSFVSNRFELKILVSHITSASSSPPTDLLNDSADEDASRSALKKLYGRNPTKPIEKNCSFTVAKCEVALYCEEGVVPEDSDTLEY